LLVEEEENGYQKRHTEFTLMMERRKRKKINIPSCPRQWGLKEMEKDLLESGSRNYSRNDKERTVSTYHCQNKIRFGARVLNNELTGTTIIDIFCCVCFLRYKFLCLTNEITT
jgi:hypothetical protein